MAETQLARALGREPALSVMIERYSALCTELAGELDTPGQQAAAYHLADLVGLALGSSAEKKELVARGGVAKTRLDLMKADVLKNLDNCNLTIEAVARANALSTRQAQRLFASGGSACCWRAGCCCTRTAPAARSATSPLPSASTTCPISTVRSAGSSASRRRSCRWNWGAGIERLVLLT